MNWLETANGVITLVIGLVSLLSAGVSVFFLVKTLLKTMKNNTADQNWKLIMKIADAAMIQVEKSSAKGAQKKEMVIDAVKAGCKEAGIECDDFIDQLVAYIDQCIDFANGFKK